ncbi:hypothetical protein Rhe02_92250 [Rhizocola hellebori]|uniref:Uncharacterized protein n=1 Tax=Rhizocola hellebori TaxID=1392758 RepID=A0A8J3VMF9_9ACTN|nr:hypothetical protein [Rhizocola hellebori]GIH11158.1 hypothetical protein Rhe02_92250 [Rhizocola hellebori]
MPPLTKLRVGMTAVVLSALAGCGVPPELAPPPGTQVPVPSATPPVSAPFPPGYTPRATGPTTTPSAVATPFPEFSSVSCNGKPTGDQVLALVKRETNISPSKPITQPVCAGTWHFTVLEVPNREPLQVLSKSEPTGLHLMAVGTDVCTVDVRRQAPTGILLAASC